MAPSFSSPLGPGLCPIPPDDPFQILYRRLWNSPIQTHTKVVQVPAIGNPARFTPFTASFLDLAPLYLTGGLGSRILARQEYHLIGQRIESDFLRSQSEYGFGGFVVLGHPGIGTSTFLYYQLFWYLHGGKPCVLQISPTRAYVFLSQGVLLLNLDDTFWSFDDTLRALGCPELMRVLVNSGERTGIGAPHPFFHSLDSVSKFFIIQATPPCSAWYKGWVKEYGANKTRIEPWSWEELYSLGTELFQQTYQELAMVYNEFGPIPRLCSSSSSQHLYDHARRSRRIAAEQIARVAMTRSGWTFEDLSLDDGSLEAQCFFLLSPRRTCWAICDAFVSTKVAAYEFCQAFFPANTRSLRRVFEGCMWPVDDSFKDMFHAGCVFEMIAHRYLAEGTPVTLSCVTSDYTKEMILRPRDSVIFIHLADVGRTSIPQDRYCIFHNTQASRFGFDAIYVRDEEVFLFAMTVESSISVDITSLEVLRTVVNNHTTHLIVFRGISSLLCLVACCYNQGPQGATAHPGSSKSKHSG
ncbi:hypothetical protein EIP91_006375 [Steccherinum ochraceum]|uniref:Uncharacterized protein n=1 Tax=Steccherinum ochraceum TaxID=92696 RepID=A0A4R0RE62_9APHY|nr:hypothetical protein EIP91_006375 [Steccherinum ochraceum]